MFTEFIAHADELQKQERKWQRQLRSVLSGISQVRNRRLVVKSCDRRR